MQDLSGLRASLLAVLASAGVTSACASTTTTARDASVTSDAPPDASPAPDVAQAPDVTPLPDAVSAPDVATCPRAPTRQCYAPADSVRQARFPPGEWTIPDGGRPVPDGGVLANGCARPEIVPDGCCNPAMALTVEGGQCCYTYCTMSCCGRPLLVRGVARVAPLRAGRAWSEAASTSEALDARTRVALADAWLRDAQLEHASVASFARFTLELMALGAPPALLEAAQRAALDEVDHTRRCLALAARHGATAVDPGALDLAGVVLARSPEAILDAAIREGCVGESLSSVLAAAQRDVATDVDAQTSTGRIADDEARHAELAWRFVAWALRAHPSLRETARASFAAALGPGAALPRPARVPSDLDARAWNAHGRLTDAQVDAALDRGVREVLRPCVAALFQEGPATAHAAT